MGMHGMAPRVVNMADGTNKYTNRMVLSDTLRLVAGTVCTYNTACNMNCGAIKATCHSAIMAPALYPATW